MEFLRYVVEYTSVIVIFFSPAGLSRFRINLSITLPLKFQLQTKRTRFVNMTFICPCIANIIPNYNQQDATFLNLFISINALQVSGGSSAHQQEHITVYKASGIVTNTAVCCYHGLDGTHEFHLIHDSSKQQQWLTIPEAVCTDMCS
jgi:hypothetical protein